MMNESKYNLTPDVLKELLRLYPKIKVPVLKYHDYYIETLFRDNNIKNTHENVITELQGLTVPSSISSYKMKFADKVIDYFKTSQILDKLNSIDVNNLQRLEKKSAESWNEKKIYISIDLCEANWAVLQKYCIDDNPLNHFKWSTFVSGTFGMPSVFAESKSFRQLILGNTNPKRLQRLQEHEIQLLILQLLQKLTVEKIMSSTSDEVIIEHIMSDDSIQKNKILITVTEQKILEELLFFVRNLETNGLKTRLQIFTMSLHNNFDEIVKVKTYYDNYLQEVKKELYAVPGNRFFLHFKKLILNEDLDKRDTYFELDNKVSQWVI